MPTPCATLKARVEGVLGIMGSGELIASLMAADLIDEYLLMIHPIVLGRGRRLFPAHVHVVARAGSKHGDGHGHRHLHLRAATILLMFHAAWGMECLKCAEELTIEW